MSRALWLALFAATTAAGADGEHAGACVAIESDAERLACYDRAFARGGEPAPAPEIDPAVLDRIRTIDPSLAANDVYAAEAPAAHQRRSLLDARWELSPAAKLGTFNLRAHRPVYLLPLFLSSNANRHPGSPNPVNNVDDRLDIDRLENKFQLSFKTKVLEGLFDGHGDVWFAYTQSSRWQLYNGGDSRPFRETNYEPEALMVFDTDIGLFDDWRLRMLGGGYAHQSNGRSLPLSRSWDRLLLDIGVERPGWVVELRPWWRIPEPADDDDNPDIADYLGRAELRVVHEAGGHEFAWLMRHSLRTGDRSHGAFEFDWSFPLHRYLRGQLQLIDGYGESMIDYNHRAFYVGLGVSLLRWY